MVSSSSYDIWVHLILSPFGQADEAFFDQSTPTCKQGLEAVKITMTSSLDNEWGSSIGFMSVLRVHHDLSYGVRWMVNSCAFLYEIL